MRIQYDRVSMGKWAIALALAAVVVANCAKAGQADEGTGFARSRYNPELDAKTTKLIDDRLKQEFGTIDNPRFDAAVPPLLGWSLAESPDEFIEWTRDGRELFTLHCVRCHGASGDGAGPDSSGLNPLPRDFRDGKFKWVSAVSSPRLHDIMETTRVGVPETAMPAFEKTLNPDELRKVALFVRWLTVRGVVETGLRSMQPDLTEEQKLTYLRVNTLEVLTARLNLAERPGADRYPPVPRPEFTADLVESGRRRYLGACVLCHGPEGKGDGKVTNKPAYLVATDTIADTPGWRDVSGNIVAVRDLTKDVFRGGDSPEDLYTRISAGIPAVHMGDRGTSSPEQIWPLVAWILDQRGDRKQTGPVRRPPPRIQVKPAGYGRITGRIRFYGPRTPEEDPRKPRQLRDPGDAIVVNPQNGGLANLIVCLRYCPESYQPEWPTQNSNVTIRFEDGKVEDGKEQPRVRFVTPGQTLIYQNDGKQDIKKPFIPAGKSLEHLYGPSPEVRLIKAPGVTIVVSIHPFVAVSNKDGRFVIENVPAGKHRLILHHERGKSTPFSPRGRVVEVPVDGDVTIQMDVSVDDFFF